MLLNTFFILVRSMYAIKRDVQTKSVTCLIGADLKGNVITNTSSPFLSSYVLCMVGPTEKLEENIIATSTWGSKLGQFYEFFSF